MKTLFINGSPKGSRGNTAIYLETMTTQMTGEYQIKNLVNETAARLAEDMMNYDTIIIMMPLYIHAMPAKVKELFEQMAERDFKRKRLGFIAQAGFEDGATFDYLISYLEVFAERLKCEYIGTVVKPGAAGTAILPRFMSGKILQLFKQLGKEYDATQTFSAETRKIMCTPYHLTKKQVRLLSSPPVVRINKVVWHYFLKKNGAFDRNYDRPFKT